MHLTVTVCKDEYYDDVKNNVEVWASLKDQGFSNYELSSFGVLMNVKAKKVVKIGYTSSSGYGTVGLVSDDDKKTHPWTLHRLLATTFFVKPNSKNKLTVDHKDRNKLNNNINNLRWATPAEQNYNRNKPVRIKSQHVLQYDLNGTFLRRFESTQDVLAENPTYTRSSIGHGCVNGRRSYGYIWKYDKGKDYDNEKWELHPYIKKLWVSDQGRVKNSKGFCTKGSLIYGYYYHTIGKRSKKYNVFSLVSETFLDIRDDEKVYRINGDISDNRLENIGVKDRKSNTPKNKKRKRQTDDNKRPKKKRKHVK